MSEHPRPHPDLGGYVLGLLDSADAATYEEHLASCGECRSEVAELSALPALLDEVPAPTTPPESLRQRTLRAVERDAVRSRRRRATVGGLLAAAAVVVLVVFVARPFDDTPFRIELAAAGGGDAAGVAFVTRTDLGRSIAMDLQDLPPSPPGTHYECWYVGDTDSAGTPARVTGGTFVAPDGGDVSVTMFTAADPSDFPHLDITLEPDDGNPARTGKVVLVSE